MLARRLIVGLGNPGAEYEWTRHNLGFMVVDKLAREAGRDVRRLECRALVGNAEFENIKVELVKPQTYMNLSGESVVSLIRKRAMQTGTKFEPQDLIVISDDVALPFGALRLRANGSSGGHNGLKSIIAATGSQDFIRLRIGIKPEHPINDAARLVLEKFPMNARAEVERILERAANALRCLLRDGIEKAMSQYN
ncbi:MAG: aminoacyl-tRNA hydrolase [Pyrinomonadaceae bacterium]